MRSIKSGLSLEMSAAGVWSLTGVIAFILPLIVSVPPVGVGQALAEVALCAPLSAWLAMLAAQAISTGRWTTWGRRVNHRHDARTFWVYGAIMVLLSACFLTGFVRGLVSLALVL